MTLMLSGKKILYMFYSCITLHCISWWKSIFCSIYPFQFFSVPFSMWLSLNLQQFFPLLIFNLYKFPFFAHVYMDHDIFPEWYCDFSLCWCCILILCSLQMSIVCSSFLFSSEFKGFLRLVSEEFQYQTSSSSVAALSILSVIIHL